MKHIITCIYLLLSTAIVAQSSMTNTTTITVDKNVDGKIVQEVFVIEGSGADEKLEELKKDKSVVNINVEKRVEMRSDNADAEEMKRMKKEVDMEISDIERVSGKKAEKREENVEVEITAGDQKEIKKYKIKIIENGKEEIIEWNGEGEMPQKMKDVMEENEVKVLVKDVENEMTLSDNKMFVMKEKNANKGQIGVRVTEVNGAVEILSFGEDSTAKNAGLNKGDRITGVNNNAVKTLDDLLDGLSDFEPGDMVTIHYTRDGKKMKKEIKLNKK